MRPVYNICKLKAFIRTIESFESYGLPQTDPLISDDGSFSYMFHNNHRICLIFGQSWLSFTPVSTVFFCDAPGIASGSDSSAPACAVDQTTRIACSATALRWMDWRRWRTRWSLWWSFPATAQDQSNWVSCGFYWWGKMSGKVWVWLVRQSGRT